MGHLRFFGILGGTPGWAEMLPVIPTSPELVLLFVAADLATAWFNAGAQAWHNAGAVTAVGAGGTFPARPEPVELRHITGAILVSLRAFTVSLVQAGLTTASADDGSQASLVLSRIEVQTVADGYALAMASVATREVWRRLPLVDRDADRMARSVPLTEWRAPCALPGGLLIRTTGGRTQPGAHPLASTWRCASMLRYYHRLVRSPCLLRLSPPCRRRRCPCSGPWQTERQ